MIDLRGLEYVFFAGVGALLMMFTVTPVLLILSLFFPSLQGWIFMPVGAGVTLGLIVARLSQ